MKKGFTLIELLIVVVIIGILAALALPRFRIAQERVLDREAKGNLVLIQGAEKINMIESGSYYVSSSISDINNYLKVSLPAGAALSWNYVTYNDRATATRNVSSGRVWTLAYTGSTATCGGIDCP